VREGNIKHELYLFDVALKNLFLKLLNIKYQKAKPLNVQLQETSQTLKAGIDANFCL